MTYYQWLHWCFVVDAQQTKAPERITKGVIERVREHGTDGIVDPDREKPGG